MAQEDIKALNLLFQRPLEPVFTSRENGTATFDLPESFYTEKYKDNSKVEFETRFGDNVQSRIPLKDITKPNLDFTKGIGRKEQFSLFIDHHKRIASQLIELFMAAPDIKSFIALCVYTKDRVNPFLFQYCYAVACQHRKDSGGVQVPPVVEVFPQNFVEPSVFKDARAEGTLISQGNRTKIDVPQNYTASDREQEQRLAYFREDIGVNSHHWHWHAVYPDTGPLEIVNKDRRGELFYYMHHQIVARYNVERICNHLAKLKPLNNLDEPLTEGYFPKIMNSNNNRSYPARPNNSKLYDVNRGSNVIQVADVKRWVDRIHEAIDKGFATSDRGQNIPLDPISGIDVLGNMVEASALTPNRQYYGNLHNMGHNLIALCHDPENRHLEEFGVMGDVSTAMRDPIFYRWHGFIDQIFKKYKDLLPPYTTQELLNTGISIKGIDCKIVSSRTAPNKLLTYWQKSDIDIAAGLDFGPNGNIFAEFTHLQHPPYEYIIQVMNESGAAKQGTCRIFICPIQDERETRLTFNEQRDFAIELDKFSVMLKPGQNIIKRRSDESSVTIPVERQFRRIGDVHRLTDGSAERAVFEFCGCGWPDHLLIPKGRPEGMQFQLFVMISNFEDDAVAQTNNAVSPCGDAYSFCGLKDKKYPDKRAMGYPFDRRATAASMADFIQQYPNMGVQQVEIKFQDFLVDKTK